MLYLAFNFEFFEFFCKRFQLQSYFCLLYFIICSFSFFTLLAADRVNEINVNSWNWQISLI